jgi:hypothetical protein
MRVKQGLPFSDTLPGAEHDAEDPWYASTEQHAAATSSSSRAEASLGAATGRAQGDDLIEQPSGGFRSAADGRVSGAADAAVLYDEAGGQPCMQCAMHFSWACSAVHATA